MKADFVPQMGSLIQTKAALLTAEICVTKSAFICGPFSSFFLWPVFIPLQTFTRAA
jgi:hypothetical protein